MICGVDEAGRGPVIGPMVVAAVWLQKKDETKLLDWGVKDSKQLSAKRRAELAVKIKRYFHYETVIVSASDIDSLRDSMSLNELEAYLFANIANKKNATEYYIDAASSNEIGFKKLVEKNLHHKGTIFCEHGADISYPVVGAASILAKEERDKQVASIAEELEKLLDSPMGSGYPSDEKTREFIKKWLTKFGDVPPYTRKSWKTVKKISDEVRQKPLF